MTKFWLDCESEERPQAGRAAFENALATLVDADVPVCVEVVFVGEDEIRSLNAQTRGIDKVTDVLSYPTLDGVKGKKIVGKDHPFEQDEDGNLCLGSVVVCTQRAREQAEEYGHSYEREKHYLITHGVLHCLGYDHEDEGEKAEMRRKEEEVLQGLGIGRD